MRIASAERSEASRSRRRGPRREGRAGDPRTAWLIILLALALGCEAPPEPITDAPTEHPGSGAARWEPVRRPSDAAMLEHPAHVIGDPASSSEIAAPFRARVVAVHVRVGEPVERGDPVLDVVMPEVLAAAATVRGAGARIDAHRARAEQLERLREEGLVDASRVFEQRAIVAELEAQRREALAVLQAASIPPSGTGALLARGVTPLRAPSSGVVRTLDARLGETREAGAPPFARIVGAGDVRIEVRSSEPLPANAEPVFEAADGARVPLAREPIASLVDPSDGMRVTWLAPSAPVPLFDGLRGRVRLTLDAADLFQVPTSALIVEGDGASLRRREGEASADVRVQVVASSGASSIVRGPLREGDLVAADPGALESP